MATAGNGEPISIQDSDSDISEDELNIVLPAPANQILGKRPKQQPSKRRFQKTKTSIEDHIFTAVEALRKALEIGPSTTRQHPLVQQLVKDLQANQEHAPSHGTTTSESGSQEEIKQMKEMIQELATTMGKLTSQHQDQTPTPSPAQKQHQHQNQAPHKRSFAEVTAQNSAPSSRQVSTKKPPSVQASLQKAAQAKRAELEKRQLILITTSKDGKIAATEQRDKINACLKEVSKDRMVVALVETTSKGNIALTTTETFDADFLIQHQQLWQDAIMVPCDRIQKKERWIRIVAHGVPREAVLLESPQLLKEEIEIFNQIKVKGLPRWISKQDSTRRAGSIVFAVETEEVQQKTLRQKEIYIAGVRAKVTRWIDVSPKTQCTNCYKFGHNKELCRNPATCKYCAKDHPTKDHAGCSTCKTSGKACQHQVLQCSNCSDKHAADNRTECTVYSAAQRSTNRSL